MLENEILNIKLLTLGESYVGKTTLILNYMNPNIKTTNLERLYPTIGVDYQKKSVTIDNRNINVEIWDTAGQEKFKKITSQYYNGADGIILIFDITNKESFKKISFWIQDLSNKIDLDNICLILIGNKTDLKDQRKVSVEEAQKYAAQYNIEYYEVSALKNVGIIEMMEFFIKKCYNNMKEKNNYSITISKDGMNYYSKKKCC
jgi:small GTP-binding protein